MIVTFFLMVPTGKIAANILNIPVISGVDDEGR
jgi:hypothetical protein